MQMAPLGLDCAPIQSIEASDLDRRIECLMRIRTLCGQLEREPVRRFDAVIARVRSDATSGDPAAREAAFSALDLLSLELCDE